MRLVTRAGLVLGLAITVPATAQTMLDKLIGKIARPAGAGGTGAGVPASAVATATPAQASAVTQLLAAPLQDRAITTKRAEAAPLIRKLVAIGACARTSEAWNAINRDALTPRTYQAGYSSELVAMTSVNYHDKSTCFDVVRLTDWTMPALNALKFRAWYISPQSGEAKHQSFELQKTTEGTWMVREIGVALA